MTLLDEILGSLEKACSETRQTPTELNLTRVHELAQTLERAILNNVLQDNDYDLLMRTTHRLFRACKPEDARLKQELQSITTAAISMATKTPA